MHNIDPNDIRWLYEDIRRRTRTRYAARAEFFSHLAGYMFAMVIGWGFVFMLGWRVPDLIQWLLLLTTGGWGLGVVIHGTQYIFKELEERAFRREIEKVGLDSAYYAGYKAKRRERLVSLSDDGELIDLDDDPLLADDEDARSRRYGDASY